MAIVPCVDGSFAPADSVSRLDDDDRALFELLAPDLKILDEPRLAALCPALVELCDDITPGRAIEIFESDHEALGAGPLEVLDWFDNHRTAFTTKTSGHGSGLCPIFPSTNGGFKPLSELSLARPSRTSSESRMLSTYVRHQDTRTCCDSSAPKNSTPPSTSSATSSRVQRPAHSMAIYWCRSLRSSMASAPT